MKTTQKTNSKIRCQLPRIHISNTLSERGSLRREVRGGARGRGKERESIETSVDQIKEPIEPKEATKGKTEQWR